MTSKTIFEPIFLQDRAVDPSERFTSTTTLTVNVLDSNDQDPVFPEDVYTAKVISGVKGSALEISPEKIRAQDQVSNISNRHFLVLIFSHGNRHMSFPF